MAAIALKDDGNILLGYFFKVMDSYVTATNILKTGISEEQCTHFNEKLLRRW